MVAPGQQLVSLALHFNTQGKLFWSPAGDRVLVEAPYTLELVTSRCSSVQQYGSIRGSFSSDSRYFALVGGFQGIKLCNATDGSQLCYLDDSIQWDCIAWRNEFSDQLLVFGAGRVRVIGCGWGDGPSSCQHLSNVITAAANLASSMDHACCHWVSY